MVNVKYSCYAYPPYGINVTTAYVVGFDEEGYYYAHGDNRNHIDIEEIKVLFAPVKGTWESVEDKIVSDDETGAYKKK